VSCSALGCSHACPEGSASPFCARHWAMLETTGYQGEIYDAMGRRNKRVDRTWSAWWRARARAIHYLGGQERPNPALARDWLQRELAFADRLDRGAVFEAPRPARAKRKAEVGT
jgi:hypothetical protein